MPITTILRIIELLLEIVVKVLDGLTQQQRAELWARHEARIDFFQKLIDRKD